MEEWWQTLREQERQSFRQQQERHLQEQFNELQQQSSALGSSYGEYDVSIKEGEASTLAVAPPEPTLASSEHDRMQCAPHDAASCSSSRKQIQVGKALSSLVGGVGRSWSCIAAGLRAHAHQRIAQLQARTSCKPGVPQTQVQSGSGLEGGAREAGVDSPSPYDQYDKAERAQRAHVRGSCLMHLHLISTCLERLRAALAWRWCQACMHASTRQRCCRREVDRHGPCVRAGCAIFDAGSVVHLLVRMSGSPVACTAQDLDKQKLSETGGDRGRSHAGQQDLRDRRPDSDELGRGVRLFVSLCVQAETERSLVAAQGPQV